MPCGKEKKIIKHDPWLKISITRYERSEEEKKMSIFNVIKWILFCSHCFLLLLYRRQTLESERIQFDHSNKLRRKMDANTTNGLNNIVQNGSRVLNMSEIDLDNGNMKLYAEICIYIWEKKTSKKYARKFFQEFYL